MVLLGHPEEVGDDQKGVGARRTGSMNSHSPAAWNVSIWRSASTTMNSSFSLSRFGVISRIRSPRWAVCLGGSKAGSWSPKGSWSR